MNWFKRHINWTFFLGGLLSWGLGQGIGIIYFMFNPFAPEEIYYLIFYLIVTAYAFVAGRWYIRCKNRSFWYLLWIPFILSGWVLLGFLCMKNKSKEIVNEENI